MHWLSYFVEHIKEIDGYNEEKFLNGELELDKDIKSNGQNKEYSIENCIFVTKTKNIKQAMLTRNNNYLQGENNPMYGKGELRRGENSVKYKNIIQLDLNMNYIETFAGSGEIYRKYNYDTSSIHKCCKGKIKTYKGYIWMYKDVYEFYKKLNDYSETDKKLEYITKK